jgi:hypothetical protein
VRRLLVLLALAGSLALCAPAFAFGAPQTGAELAGVLKDNPVYADPEARPTLTAAQAERVRLRIAERAPGRIAIAVVSDGVAGRAGGVRGLARAIDRDFDVNGALLVIDSDSDSAWVVVSYPDTEPAVRAVRAAFSGKGSFPAHTLEAVDRLAAADPGPGGEGGAAPPVTTTPDVATDVENAVKTIFIVVGVLIALPFVILVLVLVTRGLRRRRKDQPENGFEVVPTPTPPADFDAQRQAAEKAFGGDDS